MSIHHIQEKAFRETIVLGFSDWDLTQQVGWTLVSVHVNSPNLLRLTHRMSIAHKRYGPVRYHPRRELKSLKTWKELG